MKPVSILSLATETPPHILTQTDALESARELIGSQFSDFERLSAVYANAGIQHRQLAMPVDWYRSPRTFQERAAVYLEVALDLFVAAAERALTEAELRAEDIDTIVTVSTTGIATPSLEARAMARMPFRTDVARVPVFGLGCAGGASGLGLASKLARVAPGSNVLFVTVELCSLALRTDQADKADIVSTALFGDGAAACVLRSGEDGFVQITGSAEKTWNDTLDIMGWRAEPTGLGVVLNRAIPVFARREMRQAMTEMLEPQGLRIEDIDQFICHPRRRQGGRRYRNRARAGAGGAGRGARGAARSRQYVRAHRAVRARPLSPRRGCRRSRCLTRSGPASPLPRLRCGARLELALCHHGLRHRAAVDGAGDRSPQHVAAAGRGRA